ncbi:CPBP family intramembrane glutamic endopeptidase [Schleiferilactobacillus harbinensis]|uniref:CPBP family intramembrane glutamic endopeptidase n=1 Tax=Schleiferilactobacillus harbinensis TaxID=304207 RepID=UPI00345E59DF
MNPRPIYSNSRPVSVTAFWRWWFVVQGSLLTAWSLATIASRVKASYIVLGVIAVIIEGPLLLLSTLRVPRNILVRFLFALNVLLQITAYPLIVALGVNNLLLHAGITRPLIASLVMIVITVLVIVIHIPYAMALFAPLNNGWAQSIAMIYGFAWIVGGSQFMMGKVNKNVYSHIWRDLLNTGVYGAILFVVVGAIAMYQWGYRGPSWRFNPLAKPWILALLAASCLLFLGWNTFTNPNSFRSLYTWEFHLKSVTFYWFAQGLEPGIAEEWLWRYIILALLLTGLRKSRWQIPGSVFLTGLLFGLWHATNALGGAQGVLATAVQMQFAMISGWFMAALYLYSGSFSVPMIFHALIDILAMMATGSIVSTAPTRNEYIWSTVTELVFVAISIWLLTGKRRTAMQWTVDNIVPGNPLHFATPFVG